jgi:hypothetical protein
MDQVHMAQSPSIRDPKRIQARRAVAIRHFFTVVAAVPEVFTSSELVCSIASLFRLPPPPALHADAGIDQRLARTDYGHMSLAVFTSVLERVQKLRIQTSQVLGVDLVGLALADPQGTA